MLPFAHVRARWRALQVFLLQAKIDAEVESPSPSLNQREMDRLLRRQDRELHELFESARLLPRTNPLRRAAERAFDCGKTCLRADPESETFALAAHEYELALLQLRGAMLSARN